VIRKGFGKLYCGFLGGPERHLSKPRSIPYTPVPRNPDSKCISPIMGMKATVGCKGSARAGDTESMVVEVIRGTGQAPVEEAGNDLDQE
jgi:hypothetical protein